MLLRPDAISWGWKNLMQRKDVLVSRSRRRGAVRSVSVHSSIYLRPGQIDGVDTAREEVQHHAGLHAGLHVLCDEIRLVDIPEAWNARTPV